MEPTIIDGDRVVDNFIKEYTDGGYLAYEKLSERAKQILVRDLDRLEIEHEIFDRGKKGSASAGAKSPASTRQSIIRRQNGRGRKYETAQEILSDMHDLAGIRIALYHPNDLEKVEDILKNRLVEVKPPQDWPDQRFGPFPYPTLDGLASRRQSLFPGYFSRHYRVKLREGDVTEPAVEGKTLEVQLMTLLMHAWAKMHYELIYKPRPGIPQVDENDERLLDISNGVILAGEQVLRQIQINLDRKRELGRRRFGNEHDVWSYLKEKWAYNGEDAPRHEAQKHSRLGDCPLWGNRKHILYESLNRLKFDTPEMLDKLIEHSLYYYGSSPAETKNTTAPTAFLDSHRGVSIDMIIISVADQEDFKALESKELRIPRQDARNLDRSEASKMVRYMALIICNSLRLYEADSLHVVWKGRGDFSGPYPSGQEFLEILHPALMLEQSLRALARLRDFCDYLLGWEDRTWKLHCATSRLGYFEANMRACDTGVRGIPDQEFAITACPLGFIRLLDYSADNDDMAIGKSFTLLEHAQKCNNRKEYHSRHYPYLPEEYRKLGCPSITRRPGSATNSGRGVWDTNHIAKSGVIIHLDYAAVRDYLDRPTTMAY